MPKHIQPTTSHREAAQAFLRGDTIPEPLKDLLEQVVAEFGWAEQNYITEARSQGAESRVWDTTHWIIANALALEDHHRDHPEQHPDAPVLHPHF